MRTIILAVSAITNLALASLAVGNLSAADSAVIVNSGSTNTSGYRVEVNSTGTVTLTNTPKREGQLREFKESPMTRQAPAALLDRFFADLNGEKLSTLPGGGCMKSASFGTRMWIEHAGQSTPDLACGDHGNARLKALIQDASDILKLFRSE